MHLSFVVPPPALRIGGLDTAISTLKEAMEVDGTARVTCHLEQPDPKADVVHFHGLWMPSHYRAYRQCRQRGVPYVMSPHGMLEPWALRSKQWKKIPFLKLIDAPNLRSSKAIFVTSEIERRNVLSATRCEHLEVLPLGLSEDVPIDREAARAQFDLAPQDRVLLYLSRIDIKKGLDRLLDALDGLPNPMWQVWIVGDGDPKWIEALQAKADCRRRHLPRIHWLGAHWGVAKWPYLLAADLFCLPTHSENFGLAVLEALWVGTPVLTTPNTPWASHADTDGITITHNDVSHLHQALDTQFGHYSWSPAQREALKAWSREHFHWNHLRQRYLEVYTNLTKATM